MPDADPVTQMVLTSDSVSDMAGLLVATADAVTTLTLDRPEARNALDAELAAAIPAAVAEADADPDVRAIVLTGTDPAFCAGFDLREVAAGTKRGTNPHPGYWGALPPRSTPVIGAINGAAATGGLELALACDFLVASDRARFADTHAKVGVLPGWGLTIELPAAIGARRALQMSLTGEFVDASTALAWGLVNEVVPHERLLERAHELARAIASLPPAATTAVRSLYAEVAALDGDDAWALENTRAREWVARRWGDAAR
jgi:enoyl-CoA hydratase